MITTTNTMKMVIWWLLIYYDDGDVMGSNLLLISGYWRGSRGAVAINTPAGRRWGLGRRWELISNWTSKQEKPNAIVAKYSLSFKQVISKESNTNHTSPVPHVALALLERRKANSFELFCQEFDLKELFTSSLLQFGDILNGLRPSLMGFNTGM